MNTDDDYEVFKIVVIGSTGTGKTNIGTRYIRNEFNESQKATVGVEFLSKIVQVRNQKIKVTLWDTAGQERYKSLSKVYYKGASGVLIVYDITEPQTYLDVESWLRLASTSPLTRRKPQPQRSGADGGGQQTGHRARAQSAQGAADARVQGEIRYRLLGGLG
jgi:hypothetical protein